LLKIQDPFYRDAEIEGGESARQSVQVVVVNLSDCGGGNAQLLTVFVRGSVNDGKKKEGDGCVKFLHKLPILHCRAGSLCPAATD